MILSLLFTALAFARPVSHGEPLADYRTNLALLERKCGAASELSAARKAGPGLGACDAPYGTAVAFYEVGCRQLHAEYAVAGLEAEALVREAVAWRRRKSMVRDDGRTVSISFSLSSDPTYPFHKSDKLINSALAGANEALDKISEKMLAMKKDKACRSRPAKAAVKKLLEDWYAERTEDGLSQFHNALGVGLSDYLIRAQRALEAGALEEAQRGLEEELKK